MIIRVSVNNNVFGSFMHDYFNNFLTRLLCCGLDADISNMSNYNVSLLVKNHKRLGNLLNTNEEKLSQEDKEFIVHEVVLDFNNFVNNKVSCGLERKSGEYLKKNLDVKILDSFKDRNENGVAYYWCQHSNCVINQ